MLAEGTTPSTVSARLVAGVDKTGVKGRGVRLSRASSFRLVSMLMSDWASWQRQPEIEGGERRKASDELLALAGAGAKAEERVLRGVDRGDGG